METTTLTSAATQARTKKRADGRRESIPAALLLAPFAAAFLLFFLLPALHTFYMSLTESSLTRTSAFVGLANYATLVQDPSFWSSLWNTFYFALLTVIPLTVLGLVMALLVNRFARIQSAISVMTEIGSTNGRKNVPCSQPPAPAKRSTSMAISSPTAHSGITVSSEK